MASKAKSLLSTAAEELGVFSIAQSSRDTKLLCLQRFTRLSAYGASTLILALYLSSLGTSDARIGLFMTLTLLGDVIISFLLTLVADGLGRRRILILGAALMSASGVTFVLSGNYWVLVVASIIGVISPRYEPSRTWRRKMLIINQWQRNRSVQSNRGVHACPAHSEGDTQRHLCLVYIARQRRHGIWLCGVWLDSTGPSQGRRVVRDKCLPSHIWHLRCSGSCQASARLHAK